MTGSEKIDKVTALIESEIKTNKSPSEISDYIAQNIGISSRDLSSVFVFLTGQTLINYIKERKMMAAYESIIDQPHFDAQTAIAISGLGDQSTFIKSFRKRFCCSPKEAFEKKDRSALKLRLSWDNMGETEVIPSANHSVE